MPGDNASSGGRPRFAVEGADWPLREHSEFVPAGGYEWHVQRLGAGPSLLLVHGTGGATHSWRDVAPLLAPDFDVIVVDLPGHGFSEPQPLARLSIDGMADALGELLVAMRVRPQWVIGHSAGAVVLAAMCVGGALAPRGLVSANGALVPLRSLPHHVFSPVARVLARAQLPARLVARHASEVASVERLIGNTGSQLDSTGLDLYARLVACSGHVQAALDMMSRWDLPKFVPSLGRLDVPTLLLAGTRDRTIAPRYAREAGRRLPDAELQYLPGLGHLAHEEAPEMFVAAVREWMLRVR